VDMWIWFPPSRTRRFWELESLYGIRRTLIVLEKLVNQGPRMRKRWSRPIGSPRAVKQNRTWSGEEEISGTLRG
jgi:hypothetical protein